MSTLKRGILATAEVKAVSNRVAARRRGLGMVSDAPAGVYWQWRRWCLSPEFYCIDIGTALPEPDHAPVSFPLRLIGIEDDVTITPRVAASMAEFYPSAQIEHSLIPPREISVKSIGHLGLFAKRNAASWPQIMR